MPRAGGQPKDAESGLVSRYHTSIAGLALAGIAVHLLLRFGVQPGPFITNLPLFATLALGGPPLIVELLAKVCRRQFRVETCWRASQS